VFRAKTLQFLVLRKQRQKAKVAHPAKEKTEIELLVTAGISLLKSTGITPRLRIYSRKTLHTPIVVLAQKRKNYDYSGGSVAFLNPVLRCCFFLVTILLFSACEKDTPSSSGSSACGALNVKIFNGEVCNQHSRSSVVSVNILATDGANVFQAATCTGTFISVTSILTSAHCFTDSARDLGTRLAGFEAETGDGDTFKLNTFHIHPLYDGAPGSPFDLALARVDRVPAPHISPVPILISESTKVGDEVVAFGYGTNNLAEIGVLKAAKMRVQQFLRGNIIATLEESGASICPGDSGGPLVSMRNGVSTLAGVNSFVSIDGCRGGQGASFSGFVDIQSQATLDFLDQYAPDYSRY